MNRIIKEHWRVIHLSGYKDYLISNYGNVISLKHKKIRRMRKTFDNDGYYGVMLCTNHLKKRIKISILVANAFIKKVNKSHTIVNHINGIKSDDRVENLEWCTVKENSLHAVKLGLINFKGENNPSSKLKNDDVTYIRKLISTKLFSQTIIGEIFNVNKTTIRRIVIGRNWSSVK